VNHVLHKIHVIDSHTAGEPTRTVIAGGPDLGGGTVAEQLNVFREKHDRFRSAVVNEPRGSDVMVGALLVEPADRTCAAGVIFFNNVGVLGMCGHGTIGIVATLAYLGRIGPGEHRIETSVGVVTATLHADRRVSVANVPSYRHAKAVRVDVAGIGPVVGDVAWGGNWFFLVSDHGQNLALSNVEILTDYAWKVRRAINAAGYPEIDHVELFGPPATPGAHSRNFVLCPGKAYDRSPCGTGTSAKLACLAADGKLAEGQPWVQEGILGTSFIGSYEREGDRIRPTITGTAWINADANLILDDSDPFCDGIRG
jgi:4-hydroxyproline epimerase